MVTYVFSHWPLTPILSLEKSVLGMSLPLLVPRNYAQDTVS